MRGTNLVDVVRVLRAHKNDRVLPELGPWEQDLLRKRVAPSTWYSLKVFDSLLQVMHRYVYDGSEAAAQSMGRHFASALSGSDRGRTIVPGKPLESLNQLHSRWREHFNFGEVTVTPLPDREGHHGARVQLSGYPDMSACHGHAIMGWSLEIAERAGAKGTLLRLEERPWMHNNVLTFVLEWH